MLRLDSFRANASKTSVFATFKLIVLHAVYLPWYVSTFWRMQCMLTVLGYLYTYTITTYLSASCVIKSI